MNIWKNTPTLDEFVPELVAETCDAAEAEVAVIGGKKINLDSLPKLRGVFKCGIGRDNVPEAECAKRGIAVCFPSEATSRIIFEETANFAVYLIFRMLYAEIGDLESWKKLSRPLLGTKNVLLIGQGNIGRQVAEKLQPSVGVSTFDVVSNEPSELQGLIAAADVVSLHIPLMTETTGFIDAEKLAWMKDGAALVNTARGPVVDENALLHEIRKDRLRAAFDVYWQEPYTGPLCEFHPDRFLMSPHVASTCRDFLQGLAGDLRRFIGELESGE